MIFVDVKIGLTEHSGEIRIANESDYKSESRNETATFYFLYKIEPDGSKTEIFLADYDPYNTDFITYEIEEPGLYEAKIFITEDCQDSDVVLAYPDDLLDEEEKEFLKCVPKDCSCLDCNDEPFQKVDLYVRLKVMLDAVIKLEADGELDTASCFLHNIWKLLNYQRNCREC